ncbi:MAG TPA: aminotransferase class V-fold PLP-dependent enzyme, partial [Candidatus Limnocylindria bacterium]|nr:aminotransferase class V-fold PLP-dependent enzyme [Candidatus Limnocylindria bacterium]
MRGALDLLAGEAFPRVVVRRPSQGQEPGRDEKGDRSKEQIRIVVLMRSPNAADLVSERHRISLMERVYLDHAATTPVDSEVAEAMARILSETHGNPSSIYAEGRAARSAVDRARDEVAAAINADPSEIVFTSGGTEADNLAIRGAAEAIDATGRRHLIASAIEHEAVLNTLKAL